MTEHLLTINGRSSSGTDKKYHTIKTYSFTTDDDDAGLVTGSQSISNQEKILSINSLSGENFNNEDNLLETSSKLTKRKSRQQTELENHTENKPPSIRKRPWYMKIDLSKPLMIIGMVIFLYIMWIKRDIWIHRLLTSNTRIRYSVIAKNEQTVMESTDSSPPTVTISSKDSLLDSSNKEDTIDNVEKNNDEDSAVSSTKSNSAQKINIRTRRNKMSFNKDRQKKKRRHLQDSSIEDHEEKEDEPLKTEEPNLPSSTHLIEKRQPRSNIPNKNIKSSIPLSSTLHLSTYKDIIEQLRKNLKSRSRDRDFLSTLSKTTGINKDKLHRFIYKKDYQFLTLQTLIILLDSFNLMIVIVPK